MKRRTLLRSLPGIFFIPKILREAAEKPIVEESTIESYVPQVTGISVSESCPTVPVGTIHYIHQSGQIRPFIRTDQGDIVCNGAVVPKDLYPRLWEVLGKSGKGPVRIPDLRTRFLPK